MVRFYDSAHSLSQVVAEFLSEGFANGDPGIIIATPRQTEQILRALTERSVDVAALEQSGELLLLDAEETLSRFLVDGKLDGRKFKNQILAAVRTVARDRTDRAVRIFGQMVDVLWQRGERDAAVRLEVHWNQLVASDAFAMLCPYSIGTFLKEAGFKADR